MAEITVTVDEYLQTLEPERREALQALRSLIFEVAPEARESIRHGMPAYDYGGKELCLFASQKHYMSIYMDPVIVHAHRVQLQGLNVGKSCIRFRRLERLPRETIKQMLKDLMTR